MIAGPPKSLQKTVTVCYGIQFSYIGGATNILDQVCIDRKTISTNMMGVVANMNYEQMPIDHDDEPSEANSNDNICKACRQAIIDRSENPNSILCPSCREKMIRYPIPRVFVLFSIIILIIIGAAFYNFPKVLGSFKIYENSLVQAQNGEIVDALNNLMTVVEEYPDSTPVAVRMTDLSMNAGYYDAAAYVMNTYLYGKKMDDVIIDRLDRYVERLDKYYTSCDAIEEMETELGTKPTQEEMIKDRYDYIKELLNDPNQDKAILYFYLSSYSQDMDEMQSNLEKCINEDKAFLMAKVYLANLLRRGKDFINAEKYLNEVLDADKVNSGALRGLAIIRLLERNDEEGLNLAYSAYTNNPEEPYAWETYIIALNENKMISEVNAQIKAYQAEGSSLDEDTAAYLSGKLSLYDYYIDE